MAAYVKYNDFVEQLCKGIHHLHAAGDDVKVVIHSDAPTEPTDVSLSNLTQVTGTGYTAGGIDIVNDITESPAGTANLTSGTGLDRCGVDGWRRRLHRWPICVDLQRHRDLARRCADCLVELWVIVSLWRSEKRSLWISGRPFHLDYV